MFKRILLLALLFAIGSVNAQIQKPASGKIDLYKDFKSQYVTARNIEVWLPDGYTPQKKYSVLYMHDGQMLYDSSTTWNKQAWDMDDIAGRMINNGELNEFIIVGIWNDNATRHTDYFPQKPFGTAIEIARREGKIPAAEIDKAVESFKPNSDNYLRFLVTQVKPFIDSAYSVYTDKKHTFVAGSSMGGLISMYAITQYPDIFGGAACISTHWIGMNDSPENPIPLAFAQYIKESLPKLDGNKIYFDYGDRTLDASYPPHQKRVDEIMKSYPSNLWKTVFFPGKDHSEKSWRERVHVWLEFLLGK